MNFMNNPFSLAQTITWIGALVVAIVTLMAAAYSQFESKENAKEHREEIHNRLDHMDTKLDAILMQTKP